MPITVTFRSPVVDCTSAPLASPDQALRHRAFPREAQELFCMRCRGRATCPRCDADDLFERRASPAYPPARPHSPSSPASPATLRAQKGSHARLHRPPSVPGAPHQIAVDLDHRESPSASEVFESPGRRALVNLVKK